LFDDVGDTTSDVVIVSVCVTTGELVILTRAGDVVRLPAVDVWLVSVVDVVLDDDKLGVVLEDAESLVGISTVAGTGSVVKAGSVTTGATVAVSSGYSGVVTDAVVLGSVVPSPGMARAGTIPPLSEMTAIATPEASDTMARFFPVPKNVRSAGAMTAASLA
jgi:hypothetical protein